MSRKTRIRKKRSALIRTGLAKRLGALEREFIPVEKALATIVERAEVRPPVRRTAIDLTPTVVPEEAEVVIVRRGTGKGAFASTPQSGHAQVPAETLAGRLRRRLWAGPADTPPIASYRGHIEEASVAIVVPATRAPR